jgi:flavin-dependent dehydrogenase
VVVVGGGPAGSTSSAVLAMHGHKVLLVEKEKFPRYHIGESLLPFGYFPLARIGMIEKLNKSHFPRKYAVQFAAQDGRVSAPFYFHKHFQHEAAVTWQVVRGEFDQMLLENAREKGVEVREETKAAGILRGKHGDITHLPERPGGCFAQMGNLPVFPARGQVVGVTAVGKDGLEYEVRAKMTIDASGRDIFTLGKTNGRKWDPVLNKMALWTYYRGALRDPGIDAGSTTVAMLPQRGWFWYIPLPDDVVSVGVVAEKDYLFGQPCDLADIFRREVEKNLWIKQHLAQGSQFGKYHTTREYSYRGEHSAEDGLVLVGDAFAFLDPVFSSGVYLALKSGVLAADAVHEALLAGDVSSPRFGPYAERMCREIESMRKLVYVFYHQSFSFGKLVRANPDIRGDLTDCLIGNLDKDFQQLFQAVEEQAAIPESLPHGRPRMAATV